VESLRCQWKRAITDKERKVLQQSRRIGIDMTEHKSLADFRKKYPLSEKSRKGKEKHEKKMAQKAVRKADFTKVKMKHTKEDLHKAHKHMKEHMR
jgi:uncharacterized protein YxeA